MKIHLEIKKATLVQTFSIGVFFSVKNWSADKPQLCIVQYTFPWFGRFAV